MNQPASATRAAGDESWKDLAKIAAAATALLTALGGLAATGLLARTQRNHPGWFLTALAFVIAAAALWVLASVTTSTPVTLRKKWLIAGPSYKLTSWRAQVLGVVLFAIG